jgi:hypothetical protein
VATRPERGEPYFVGQRRRPLGLDGEKEGRMPYDQLLPRVQRFAVREYSRQPDLPPATFQQRLAESFAPGEKLSPETVADLLELQRIWNFESDWYWPSPLLDPAFFRQRAKRLNWPAEKLRVYPGHLDRLREIASRHGDSASPVGKEMARLAQEIVKAWGDEAPAAVRER